MTPSKGTMVYWADNPTHTASPPAALPTSYPVSGGDLTTWTRFDCVMDIGGLDDHEQEVQEHRCLDEDQALVEDFATGFIKAAPVTMKTTYDSHTFVEFRAGKLARKQYRILIVLPLAEDQATEPDRFAYRVRCTKCNPMVDANGNPIETEFEFKLYGDTGVHEPGS